MSDSDRLKTTGAESGGSKRHEVLTGVIGRLRIIMRELNQHSNATEDLIGISTTELLFLQHVCRNPGLQLSDIASAMCVHQSTSSNVKRGLLEKSLVKEQPDPSDKRVTHLYPTDAGGVLVMRAMLELRSPLRQATDEAPPEDLAELERILNDITDRIEDLNAEEREREKSTRDFGKPGRPPKLKFPP